MVIQLIQFAIHTANTGTSGGDCGRGKYRLPRTVCPHDVARCLNADSVDFIILTTNKLTYLGQV